MKKFLGFLFVFAGLFLVSFPASAHEAHVHGLAHLNISVGGGDVSIEMTSALANVISFEHAPETDAQKQEVRNMAALMRKAENLFLFPAEADCKVKEVALESAVLPAELLAPKGAHSPEEQGGRQHKHDHAGHEHKHGEHKNDAHEHAHGNLEADISFMCGRPEKLNSLKVDMFRAFPSLHEVEVQLVTPKGQSAAELTAKTNTLRW